MTATAATAERTYSERQAAQYLEINLGTLRVYRFRSRITPATTSEQTGVVLYKKSELDRFSRNWGKTIRLNAMKIGWGTTRSTNKQKQAVSTALETS